MQKPLLVRTIQELQAHVASWHQAGERVGLVPTMGALHHGHLSLVKAISEKADRVIVTIFVNPTQFGEGEDLDKYPRQEEKDLTALSTTPCDLVFAPAPSEIYPDGYSTTVSVSGLSELLEGASRPGHFDGVATVVTKLLLMSRCDIAIFGEKDFQQLAVIRRFVTDLNIPVEIMGGALIREEDGLAASSRNAYLNDQERRIAGQFNVILKACIQDLKGGMAVNTAEKKATESLLTAGFKAVDYVTLVDPASLTPLPEYHRDQPARLVAVARIGGVRLLDNMAV